MFTFSDHFQEISKLSMHYLRQSIQEWTSKICERQPLKKTHVRIMILIIFRLFLNIVFGWKELSYSQQCQTVASNLVWKFGHSGSLRTGKILYVFTWFAKSFYLLFLPSRLLTDGNTESQPGLKVNSQQCFSACPWN